MSEEQISVYTTPEGHGRFMVFKESDNSFTLISYYAEEFMEPGSIMTDIRELDDAVPIFGVSLTNPKSARAWADTFAKMAEFMESAQSEQSAPQRQ